jgi:lactate permease
VVAVSANATGGVTGKMISPQSIAVGAAAVGLIGRESELFRFTAKHSFIMLFLICIITLMQAYVMQWMIPKYKMIEGAVVQQVSDNSSGFLYLILLLAGLVIIASTVVLLNRKKADF